MPRTNKEVDRETKIDKILEAAESRVLEKGYDGMSVVAIARELGIAQNSIYWYFPSKDDLFVAVLQRIVTRELGEMPPASAGTRESLLWMIDRLDGFEPLRVSVIERAKHSERVAEFDRNMIVGARLTFSNALRPHVPPASLEDVVDTFFATAEGVLRQRLSKADRRRVLSFALARLAGIEEDGR